MRSFEYARPATEAEACEMLSAHDGNTVVLAGGTDLMNLLRRDLLTPARVVDIGRIPDLREVVPADGGWLIGALATLDRLAEDPGLAGFPALRHVVRETRALQVTAHGTLGGDLCHLPNCWYFRNGYGLLGNDDGEPLVEEGDNRLHAVFGNQGPAKYVCASRFAPALIAHGARARIAGPQPGAEEWIPLEYFFVTPRTPRQGTNVLKPGQFLTHVWLPDPHETAGATYEVLQTDGLDWPLAAAACTLGLVDGLVTRASVVLGHVAPVPWVSHAASVALVGRSVSVESAEEAADAAVASATPLSCNEYKVQLARTAVKRAVLRASGLPEGGL